MDTIHSHVPTPEPEARDANISLVVWTTVAILVTLVICMAFAALQFKVETDMLPKAEASPFSKEGKLPPEPRLQAFPAQDLMDFKARQLNRLESYGYVDKEAGIAHVPVEEAIAMVLKKGLPVKSPNAPAQTVALSLADQKAAAEAKKKAAEAKK